MYLFVFIFVVLSVLGLYTQLFTMRMAEVMSHQTGVAQTMMMWHGAADYLTRDHVAFVPPVAGCSVSVATMDPYSCGFRLTLGNLPPRNVPYLPGDYNLNTETTFSSVVYTSGTINYLLTYITAGETKLGFTAAQIHKQMMNARFHELYYGVVAAGGCSGPGTWLKTTAYSNALEVCYPIPAAVVPHVPVGSIGILSIL